MNLPRRFSVTALVGALGGLAIVSAAWAFDTAPAATTTGAQGQAAAGTVAPQISSAALAAQLKLFEQVNHLSLTSTQVQDFTGLLYRLYQAEIDFGRRTEAATRPVLS